VIDRIFDIVIAAIVAFCVFCALVLFIPESKNRVEDMYPLPPNYHTDICARLSYDLVFRADVGYDVLDSTMRAVGCAQDAGGVYVAMT
jgi:hypothetical protein